MMPEKKVPRLCRTCGKSTQEGEIRCWEHESAFQQWLSGESGRRSDYTPRYNGVIGIYEAEVKQLSFISRSRVRLSRGLRAGEELKFD
jgi:hypothetical protein